MVCAACTALAIASSRREPAQVSEDEQCLCTHDDRQLPLELLERVRVAPPERGCERCQRVVDQAEPVPGPHVGKLRPDDRGGDHRADRTLVGQHAAQQMPRGVPDPLDRIGAVLDRRERLGRRRPGAGLGLEQQRDQIRKVPVRGCLGDQRRLRDRRHRDLRASFDQLMDRLHDGGAGTLPSGSPGPRGPHRASATLTESLA